MVLKACHRGVLRAGVALAAALAATLALAAPAAGAAEVAPSPDNDPSKRYVVRAAAADDLRRKPPQLPDLTPYTREAVVARIGRAPTARVSLQRIVDYEALGEFVSGGGSGRLQEWASRQNTNPVAIVIGGGHMTLPELAEALPSSQFEEVEPGVFMLRLPLLVEQDATLVIDDKVRELRLSQERGAFLVNDGHMFVVGTRLTAWRERERAPAKFRKPTEFRPFLVSWGGAELYIVDSTVTGFGYDASKAYGISISQYSPGRNARLKRPPATGWILDSEFVDSWFGFYCYEAKNVVVAGNRYRDNVVYGVDPHDFSSGLIIANNEISGTRKKHGLIISREVNDSWIFGNRVHGSALSGIMLDRNSMRNVVADNTVYRNGSDGITIYESPDNLLWNNRVVGNAKHGIRVRNSVRIKLYHNDAIANGASGIDGHVKDLTGTDRNVRMDPFNPEVSMIVVGGKLIHNGSGPVSIDKPLSLELYNVQFLAPRASDGVKLKGVLGHFQDDVLDLLVRQRRPVIIEPVDDDLAGES